MKRQCKINWNVEHANDDGRSVLKSACSLSRMS